MAVSDKKKLYHLQNKWIMNSTTVIIVFLLQLDASDFWCWGRRREKEAFNFPVSKVNWNLAFQNTVRAT